MNSKNSPVGSLRYEGCTLTGALSVTTQVRDAVTVIHGPSGCTHHNFSLLHAISAEQDDARLPPLVSTALSESEIIFGGEEALARTLQRVADDGPTAIFVLSTCITETIGDDIRSVCARDLGVPVVPVPTAGFLGGAFSDGLNAALTILATLAGSEGVRERTVTVIGEKNLEFEVEENFAEVERLLELLGLRVGVRFMRKMQFADFERVGSGSLNLLREPALRPVGEALKMRFGTPYIDSFPIGLEGGVAFLQEAAAILGLDPERAVEAERAHQAEMLSSFADLRGAAVSPDPLTLGSLEYAPVRRVMAALDLKADAGVASLSLPYSPPVGTAGIRRLLHRWRRKVHA
jgi:nitrogenase molybdenum-iron protein alpha/beta subunit